MVDRTVSIPFTFIICTVEVAQNVLYSTIVMVNLKLLKEKCVKVIPYFKHNEQ